MRFPLAAAALRKGEFTAFGTFASGALLLAMSAEVIPGFLEDAVAMRSNTSIVGEELSLLLQARWRGKHATATRFTAGSEVPLVSMIGPGRGYTKHKSKDRVMLSSNTAGVVSGGW